MAQSFLLLQEHLLLIIIKLQVADQACLTSPILLQGLPEHSLVVHSKKVMQSAMQLFDTRLVCILHRVQGTHCVLTLGLGDF